MCVLASVNKQNVFILIYRVTLIFLITLCALIQRNISDIVESIIHFFKGHFQESQKKIKIKPGVVIYLNR